MIAASTADPVARASDGARARERREDLWLALVVGASRLPFLGAGFGTDTDTWKLAYAAREIGRGHGYIISRTPGYPIQELASALVWRGGPWALNALTAIVSVVATVLVARLLRRAGARDAWLGALAFAFTPTVYISSVSAIDYLWALAFILAAMLAALRGRFALPGILLGLATGTRITSIVLAPALAIAAASSGGRRPARILGMMALAAVIGAAWYVPGWLRYGPTLLTYSDVDRVKSGFEFVTGMFVPHKALIPVPLVLGQATVGVFGVIGTAALALSVVPALLDRGRAPDPEVPAAPRLLLAACALVVFIEILLYVRLPHDEGYLIPAIPFALVLVAAFSRRTAFRAVAVALVVSPFLLGVDIVPPKKGLTPATRSPLAVQLRTAHETFAIDPLRGPLLMDWDKRRRMMDVVHRALATWIRDPSPPLLLAGTLNPVLFYEVPDDPRHPRYVDMIDRAELDARLARGQRLVYLPDVRERTMRMKGYDLRETGAQPLMDEGTGTR